MNTDDYVPSDEDMAHWVEGEEDPEYGRALWDRWLAAHDARVRRDAVEEYKDRQVQIHISPAPTQMVSVPVRCPKCGYQ